MKRIYAALELVFWRFFMMLWPWMRWPRATAASLRGDFWAGLTGATLVLPQGIAFALIAGVPPRFGLYSAMIAAVIAALFGSSWHLVSGPTVALSVVLPTVLVPYAAVGSPEYIALSLLLMFLVGAIQLGFSVFRLGGLVNFISPTVVTGFTAGAGILIIFSQLPDFFGVQLPRAPDNALTAIRNFSGRGWATSSAAAAPATSSPARSTAAASITTAARRRPWRKSSPPF